MISCVIGTFGSMTWQQRARQRAIPSTDGQGFDEVIPMHLAHGTLAQARNGAGADAKSEWLLFLDADDELAPGFGDAMRKAIKRDLARPALFTPAVAYGPQTRPKIWPRIDWKAGNWCIIGTLIQRELFLEIGGFGEYALYEDYALWATAAEAGAVVFEVPKAVYIAHPTPASRNRAPGKAERLYWHQRIGCDIWPDHFAPLTPEEDSTHRLVGPRLRFA